MTDRSEQFLALLEAHQKIVFKVASLYCWDAAERDDLRQEISRLKQRLRSELVPTAE